MTLPRSMPIMIPIAVTVVLLVGVIALPTGPTTRPIIIAIVAGYVILPAIWILYFLSRRKPSD